MNEYEISCRGVYRGMEWTIIEWIRWRGIFFGRIKPIFYVDRRHLHRDEYFELNEYGEYVDTHGEATKDDAKSSIKDFIDTFWMIPKEKRITVFPVTVLGVKDY